MRAPLHFSPRRAGEGRAQDAAIPRPESERAGSGDRRRRWPRGQADYAVAVERHPRLLRGEVRETHAEGRRRARGDVAGADERLDRHHSDHRVHLRGGALQGAPRADRRDVQGALPAIPEGLGRRARLAEVRGRRGDDHCRHLALRWLGAHQGVVARIVRGSAEPRALGEGPGRAPGDAARDEILTPSVPFRRQPDPRQPGEPLLLRLVVQEEDGAGPDARRPLARRGELDAAGGDRAQRFDVHLDALEQPSMHVDAAGIPKGGALAHETRVALVDEHVYVGRGRIRCEVDVLHYADLYASVMHRRVGADRPRPLGAQHDLEPWHAQAHRRRIEPRELVSLRRFRVARRQHLDLRPGEHRVQPLHAAEADLRPHNPEHRAFTRDVGRGALQARAHQHVLVVAAELHAAYLAHYDATVLHRGDADAQTAAVAETDGDFGAALLVALPDEKARDRRGHQRHQPGDIEPAPPAQPPLRQLLAGHAVRSPRPHMLRGSKLAEASMVSTTTAVKATRPGPGRMVAIWPSFTSATRTASRKTSSIAHGPTTSMKR